MRSSKVVAKLIYSKRLIALLVKSGGRRFDFPLIKSSSRSPGDPQRVRI